MTVRLIIGDCLAVLKTLPALSVHTCVTSPPYFGLRDYGTAAWEGGEADCDHLRRNVPLTGNDPGLRCSTLNNAKNGGNQTTTAQSRAAAMFDGTCGKCGATRIDSQLGLEPTPADYVANLVAVFREVRRVLRDDGTVWLNLGDSYCSTDKWGGGGNGNAGKHTLADDGSVPSWAVRQRKAPIDGTKPKDLLGIPWMVAFSLRDDGWYLRSDIIWHKPNPMPESVTDRPTKSHEYIFLLSKRERYYYDAAAIREDSLWVDPITKEPIDSWGRPIKAKSYGNNCADPRDTGEGLPRTFGANVTDGKRNRRTVWTVATQPYNGAHFATFPPALIKPCVLAGCPEGGTVLDPFSGAGTTGLVADRLHRNAVLIELNPAYAEMAQHRIVDDGPLFAEVAVGVPEQEMLL